MELADVFTFNKYGSFGVARFPDGDRKREFKQWLQATGGLPGDLWAGDNLGKEERTRQRTVGKVKRAICEMNKTADGVDVDYKRCVVRYNR